ncbi:hypothetical protein A5881_002927 [Enterococcus termitis]|nr:hypothetical protein A5881_002418 [Enterococcus termitis]
MKFGVRKPSIKKSISARTTGKAKRTIKKAVNPTYGKKGMGLIKNPKKSIYNKVYNKTTISTKNILSGKKATNSLTNQTDNYVTKVTHEKTFVNKWLFILLSFFLGMFGVQWFYAKQYSKGFTYLIFCWTTIPYFLGMFQAIQAIFKPINDKGEILV